MKQISGGRLRLMGVAPIAFLVVAGLGSPARAQEAAQQAQGAGTGLETIIVTAEKRSENIQQVPISVTAFSQQALQDKGVTDVHALSLLTPNVNLDAGAPFGGDSSVLSASIRGIGQDDFGFNVEPGVGVYVDGIYYARTQGSNANLLDVQDVEILKGPQGTLYGRNTIGGAINIVTRTPGDLFTFEGQVTGGSYDRRDIAATADIPISDTLLTSITISSVQRDGYQTVVPYHSPTPYVPDPITPYNTGTTTSNDPGGQNSQTIRTKILWKAADDLKITLSADWTHQDQPGTPNTVLETYPDTPGAAGSIAALYNLCVTVPGIKIGVLCSAKRGGGTPALNSAPFLIISPQATQTGNIDTTYSNGPSYARLDTFGGAFTIDYNLTDDLALKAITGYRRIQWVSAIDLDGAADNGQLLNVNGDDGQHELSQELQLTGTAFDSRLNYVGGVYYFSEGGFEHGHVPFDGGLLMIDGLNVYTTDSYAAYLHADYKITDQLGLTLGGRYSYDHKTFIGGQTDQNGLSYKVTGCYPPGAPATALGAPSVTCQQALGFPVASQPFRYIADVVNPQDFYEFTPTAGVQYHFTDDLMTYASWSKGFKSGGYTTRLSSPVLNPAEGEFGPEKAETYEVGLKSEWFDNHLVVNLAGFYTNYDQIQLVEQVGASPVTKNLGTAVIEGGELETMARLGGGFTLTANAGYMDAYYTQIDASVGPPFTLGTKLPKTPKWKFALSPEYDYTLGNDAVLRFLADFTHTSSLFNDSENTALLRRPTEDILSASVQYASPDDRYEVIVGGTNITDQRYITTGSFNYAAGFVDATYNEPAEWYITFRVKFQGEKAPAPYAAPPAPPPVAQAPAPAAIIEGPNRSFQVFFDFDKSDITAAAASVIKAAADLAKQGNSVKITVIGHTDTVGTARYNQALSERRAAAVKAQLVADGLAGGEITTTGVGKAGLLVPTADGIREPQNRRAEINVQ